MDTLNTLPHDEIVIASGSKDLIVNWQVCRADDSFTGLARDKLHFVGDCISPRSVEIAMAEAEKVAATL